MVVAVVRAGILANPLLTTSGIPSGTFCSEGAEVPLYSRQRLARLPSATVEKENHVSPKIEIDGILRKTSAPILTQNYPLSFVSKSKVKTAFNNKPTKGVL